MDFDEAHLVFDHQLLFSIFGNDFDGEIRSSNIDLSNHKSKHSHSAKIQIETATAFANTP